MDFLPYIIANRDFFRPITDAADMGRSYQVSDLPSGWSQRVSGIWSVCSPPDGQRASHGWKVHVSADLDRAQHVLDVASTVLIERSVPFKHLRNALAYTWLHHKQGPRSQSGKFIAAYPPDEDSSRAVMEALSAALADERGPYILSDRRYGESSVVAYRYGAYVEIPRTLPDGTRELLVPDGSGRLVPDRRGLAFTLPEGVADPFLPAAAGRAAPQETPDSQGVSFEGLAFQHVLRHANGGGAYIAIDKRTGDQVFVKEARGRTGLHWGGDTAAERLAREHQVLTELASAVPGLAPRPLGFFERWEHSFLVTEVVAGTSLHSWVIKNMPNYFSDTEGEERAGYDRRCQEIFGQLEEQLHRLHAAGYVFVDVSPRNVLVDANGTVRLIDFETAGRIGDPLLLIGTDGYFPDEPHERLQEIARDDPRQFDEYGLAAIAQLLLFGMVHHVVRREPGAIRHLSYHTAHQRAAPRQLWRAATRIIDDEAASSLPGPEEVAADPRLHLRNLRDRTADALLAMADADAGADVVFPTVPRGYASNPHSVAYGTAGVLHALRLAGRSADPRIVRRLADDALRDRDEAAPGLHVGNAGIAWVLADHGLIGEANELLDAAETHPILGERATLGEGAAGVALTHLALLRHDPDEAHLDRALRLRAAIPDDDELAGLLGAQDATGLLHGRPGIALLDHYLYRLTGDCRALRRGLALLSEEASRAVAFPGGGIGFRVSADDIRMYPYLHCGSAGFALVAARFLPDADAGLADLVGEALVPATTPSTVYSGLYEGHAGLLFALAEHAALTGSADSRTAAFAAAARLFSHAVAHPTGVRFHGEYNIRFSADLWSGSAGVLLALTRLLDDVTDSFFTVDALATAFPALPTAQSATA